MDGDEIEKAKHKSEFDKSVDCIIINKQESKYGYDVILCELSKGRTKKPKDIKEKFENSGVEIFNIFNSFDLNINSLSCIFLSSGINDSRAYKELNKYLNLANIKVRGVYPNNIYIQMRNCGFNINGLNLERFIK